MSRPKEPGVPRIDVERHQQALLAAAADVLARDPDFSMAQVAQAANLTRATLYRHFSNRQTLLKAIQGEALKRATETIAACSLDDGTALEALRRVVGALGTNGLRFRVILGKASDHSQGFLDRRDQVLAPVVEVIKRGQLEGDVRTDLSPEWIVTAMATLLMAAVRGAPPGKNSDVDMSDLVFRTLVGGIATDPHSADPKN